MTTPLVVIVGDTHIGGYTALFPPRFELSDHNVLLPSPVQQTIYGWWIKFWGEVYRLRQGRKLIVVHMGDVVDGTPHSRTTQSISNIADQERAALQILRPVRAMADEYHQLTGTEAHVGDSWQSERRIGDALKATTCGPELALDVEGVLFDLSHHGRVGSRPWSSSAIGVVSEIINECVVNNWPIPRFVVRGHTHRVDDSGESHPLCRAFISPAWQARNSYAYKFNSFRRADIGGVIVDGQAVTIRRYYGEPHQRVVHRVTAAV